MIRAFVVAAAAALLVGCVTGKIPVNEDPGHPVVEDSEYEAAQMRRVHESFDRMQKAIVDGDTKTYFELLSRAQQVSYGTYDAFLRDYAQNGNGWREMWRGASVVRVSVENEKATVQIRWSTPAPRLIEWILEDGTWRLHFAVPRSE